MNAKELQQTDRLRRLVDQGDLAAARELYALARRRARNDLWRAAASVMLAEGCWSLDAFGATVALDGDASGTTCFGSDGGTGTVALSWGVTNRWDLGRTELRDELALRAAEIAVQQVLGHYETQESEPEKGDGSLDAETSDAMLWPGPAAHPAELAQYLAEKIVIAQRDVAEQAAAWERLGRKKRRPWLPQRVGRRRRRRRRKVHLRAWAGIVAAAFVRDTLVTARFGTGETFVVRENKLICLTAPGGTAERSSGPRVNLVTEVEPRRPEAEDVFTAAQPIEPGDRILLVGPGFSQVRDLLNAQRLVMAGTCEEAARNLAETWARVASGRARNNARGQPSCVVAELQPG